MNIIIYHFYGLTPSFFGMLQDEDYLKINSPSTHFWNFALKRLAEKYYYKCEVHLYTKERQTKCTYYGQVAFLFHPIISIPCFKIFGRFLNKNSLGFAKYLVSKKPTFFVFYGGVTISFLPILIILLIFKIPFVVQYHGMSLYRFGFFKKTFYQKAKAIITPSITAKREISSYYQVHVNRISVIPCGINTDFYKPMVEKKSILLYPKICFVGALIELKSFREAIECFAYIKRHFKEAQFEVAGDYRDYSYREKCDELIRRLGIHDSIKFYGLVEKEKLREIYNNSDLLLFISKEDALGRSLLEAMACGTPAVALKQAVGPREIINNGENGALTDLNKLNKDVLDLLLDKDKLNLYSSEARKTVVEKYSFESSFKKAEYLYNSVIESVIKRDKKNG